MISKIKILLKKVALKGEINAIKQKILVPGPLARIEGWKENLEYQLRGKEEELERLERP